MSRLSLNLDAISENMATVDALVRGHGAHWTLVVKVLSGWDDVLRALLGSGVGSVADSRLGNLRNSAFVGQETERWYLRPPCLSQLPGVVRLTDISLNSDLSTVEALGAEAGRQGKTHGVVVMVELGDLREGLTPGALGEFFDRSAKIPHIRIIGIGSNLGCLSGAVPTVDQFSHLAMYRELMQLKYGSRLPLISAGTSAVLPMILNGTLAPAINHFRIGESVFLGTDLINGGTIPGLRSDAITYEAEIVEIGEKGSCSAVEILDVGPFKHFGSQEFNGQRDVRAVVSVGQLDTVVQGLQCENPDYRIVGASSDLAVVSLGRNTKGCRVGDMLKFRPSYGALVRLTAGKYVERVTVPSAEEFLRDMPPSRRVVVPPTMPATQA